MSVFTQDVSSWVEIDADNFTLNFHVTEIEVTRTAQKDTGKATIKGVINNPDLDDYSDQLSATQEQQISVHTATETSETPWDANLTSEQVIFIGDIINLKQNKDGVFIFEAFDVSRVLKNKRIQLASESNNTAIDVITDILSNELSRFNSVANSYEEASLTTPYVETVDIQPSPWNFGTDEKGVPLIDAMYDLIKSYGGVLWVDRKGILRIEKASPERWKNIEVPFITDISAGEDNRNADRVIFEGTGTSSELGQAGAYVHSQTSYSSASGIGNIFSGNDLPEKNLSDENVTTQEEADQRSFNEAVSTEQNRDMGEITVIGNGSIELFDRVTVPELKTSDGIDARPLETDVREGTYNINTITHKINASDGFLTTLELTPSLLDTYEDVDPEETAIQTEYLSARSNKKEEDTTSGLGNGTGGLFGGFL